MVVDVRAGDAKSAAYALPDTTARGAPPADAFAGHLGPLNRDTLGFYESLLPYGDLVRLRFLAWPGWALNHPDLIEDVLVRQAASFQKPIGLKRTRRLLGRGILVADGDAWRRQRRLAMPAFHRARVATYVSAMAGIADAHLAQWADGDVRGVMHEMTAITLDIATRTLFGADAGPFARAVETILRNSDAMFHRRLTSWEFLVPDTWPLPQYRDFHRDAKALDEIVFGIIRQRRAAAADTGDLLSMYLQSRDEDGSSLDDNLLRDEVMTLLLAGHDTTALLLSWGLWLLMRHPDAESRVRREVDEVLGGPGGRAATFDDLPALREVRFVIDETLRLYPPAFQNSREATVPVTLGGVTLPARSTVLWSTWAVHRDPRWFPDPLAFRPERFAEAGPARPRLAFHPFGAGPRMCIGNTFAIAEATVVLAEVLRRFRLEVLPGQDVRPFPAFTLRLDREVYARVRLRRPGAASE
ncbi:MAG: cytochrome P450 [Chloroflexi bacterium]|jgi:cytochrome P450|nr:cytochrome P450 [Chloroflexota bacterium]